jgi:hypothetical protein
MNIALAPRPTGVELLDVEGAPLRRTEVVLE